MSTKSRGFTLIELMLSMSFVAVLLVTMILAIMHITNTYTKGVTVKSVNQAGRDISDTMRRDGVRVGLVGKPIPPANGGGLGRACLGSYSYIWNEADNLLPGANPVKYKDTDTPIVFARVSDADARYCKVQVGGGYEMLVDRQDAVEMLPDDKGDYALHMFSISRTPDFDQPIGNSPLYHIKYTIGTNEKGSLAGDMATLNKSCRPPSDVENNFNFCSINTFELILRAD